MSNDNSSISYIKILDTDTRSIEMHRIKCDLVESRNKSKLPLVIVYRFTFMRHFPLAPELSIFSETLGKRVVVDFQLCDFVILVGCDPKEGGLWE